MDRLPGTPGTEEDPRCPSTLPDREGDKEPEGARDKKKTPPRLNQYYNAELVNLFFLSMAVVVQFLNEFQASEYKRNTGFGIRFNLYR